MDIAKHEGKSSFHVPFPISALFNCALEGQQAEVRPTCGEAYIRDLL
jgi:hypothetical protein